jgi:hypothetical protein
MSSTRQRSRSKLVTTVVLVAIAAVGCSSDDTYLPVLLADPMASYEAEGIELIDAWEQAEGHSLVADKPIHAEVGRTFRIVDQDRAVHVLEEAADYAEANGWRLTTIRDSVVVSASSGYGGAKDLGPGDGRLSVALIPDDPLNDPDWPLVLRIFLDFGSVRFDESTTTSP